MKKFLCPNNDWIEENFNAEHEASQKAHLSDNKEMTELEKREVEEQSRSRYLIEMSKRILEYSKRPDAHSGHQSQQTLGPIKIQSGSNQASIPSLVETQNDSQYFKSRDEQRDNEKRGSRNVADTLLPRPQNMMLHTSNSSTITKDKQEGERQSASSKGQRAETANKVAPASVGSQKSPSQQRDSYQ